MFWWTLQVTSSEMFQLLANRWVWCCWGEQGSGVKYTRAV